MDKKPNHRPQKEMRTDDPLDKQFYSIDEVAEILGVHRCTIKRAIDRYKQGDTKNGIKAFKLGTKWRIKKEDIEKLGD